MPRRALVTAAIVALAACQPGAHRVPMPNEPAPPRVILLSYLDALLAGDCATARALSVPATANQQQVIWCDSPHVVAYQAPSPSDPPGGNPSVELVYGLQLNVTGGDNSVIQGWGTWFIDLRPQPDGTWRVFGIGSGP